MIDKDFNANMKKEKFVMMKNIVNL